MSPHALLVIPLVASFLACASPQPREPAAIPDNVCATRYNQAECERRPERNAAVGPREETVPADKKFGAASKYRAVTLTSAPPPPRPPPAAPRPPAPRPPPRR